MSDGELADLVDQVRTKAVGPKPPTARYVGLEHLRSMSPRLAGTSPASVSDSTNGVFESGDILFGKLRPNLRKSVQVAFGGFCSTDLIIMRAKVGVDPAFAAHAASSDEVFRHAERESVGTGMPRTSWAAVAKAPCLVPPLEEQQRIAEILDTIDETIQATEHVIAKLSDLRSGLVETAFCTGAKARLGEIGVFMNGLNKPASAFGRGARFVNIGDVYPETLDPESLGRMACTASELSRFGLIAGDILLDRSSVKLEGVGYPTLFRSHSEPVVFCGFILRFRPNRQADPAFLVHQLRSEKFRQSVLRVATVSANINVNQASLNQLMVRLPSLEEQKRISGQIDSAASAFRVENERLSKLRATRAGLAADLLSGRVRTVAM